jgi:hypothetical protein
VHVIDTEQDKFAIRITVEKMEGILPGNPECKPTIVETLNGSL